jgi:Ricin-type beta-trefoil lectin domain-like
MKTKESAMKTKERAMKTEASAARAQSVARSRSAMRAIVGSCAMAVAAAVTSFATIASAYAGVEIENAARSRVDVMWASTSAFQGAFLWPDNASASQEFDLLDSGNGFYRIRARHSGQCLMLDWRGGSYGNGTPIIQYPACSANYAPAEWSTHWVWVPDDCTDQCFSTGQWYALIENRATGRCLDANNPFGGLPGDQSVIQQWDCISSTTQWNAFNQLWSFGVPTSELLAIC